MYLYGNSSSCVKMSDKNTEYFKIETEVIQGCILYPFLFLLVIGFIMEKNLGIEQKLEYRGKDDSPPRKDQKTSF